MTPHYDPVFAIGIFTGIGAVLSWIFGAVADIAAAVAAALTAVWAVLSPILLALWNFISGSWDNVIKPLWNWGKNIWSELECFYFDHLKGAIDWIQGLNKTLRKVYETFVAPIRDAISVLEQFLRLTGLSQTAFGKWLDGELHRIDQVINDAWRELVGPVNLLLHIVNEVILDARGILQAPLLLESTAVYMGSISAQFLDHAVGSFRTDWKSVIATFHTGPAIQPSVDDGRELFKGFQGPLAPTVQHGHDVFLLIANDNWTEFDYVVNGVGSGGSETA